MNFSVAINTLNAEHWLADVLQSVADCQEVVICDMYSTDRTVEIAKAFGARVIYHERTGYVEPARNYLISQVKTEWVLLLDADETVSQDLKELLDKIAQENKFAAVKIPRRNYFLGKFMHAASPDYNIRFFRKKAIHWPEHIHSTPEVNGSILTVPNSQDLSIEHLANDSLSDILRKTDTYTDAEVKRRAGKKISLLGLILSPFIRFLKFYFLKKGFQDGIPGLIFAVTKAHYKFYTLAKIYQFSSRNEAKNHRTRST